MEYLLNAIKRLSVVVTAKHCSFMSTTSLVFGRISDTPAWAFICRSLHLFRIFCISRQNRPHYFGFLVEDTQKKREYQSTNSPPLSVFLREFTGENALLNSSEIARLDFWDSLILRTSGWHRLLVSMSPKNNMCCLHTLWVDSPAESKNNKFIAYSVQTRLSQKQKRFLLDIRTKLYGYSTFELKYFYAIQSLFFVQMIGYICKNTESSNYFICVRFCARAWIFPFLTYQPKVFTSGQFAGKYTEF